MGHGRREASGALVLIVLSLAARVTAAPVSSEVVAEAASPSDSQIWTPLRNWPDVYPRVACQMALAEVPELRAIAAESTSGYPVTIRANVRPDVIMHFLGGELRPWPEICDRVEQMPPDVALRLQQQEVWLRRWRTAADLLVDSHRHLPHDFAVHPRFSDLAGYDPTQSTNRQASDEAVRGWVAEGASSAQLSVLGLQMVARLAQMSVEEREQVLAEVRRIHDTYPHP